jgi:hypothetical protein
MSDPDSSHTYSILEPFTAVEADPVGHAGLLADPLGPLPGQVPQLTGRSGRDEAGPQKAVLE